MKMTDLFDTSNELRFFKMSNKGANSLFNFVFAVQQM